LSTNATTYRTKEEVLLDLAKALNFSPQALESNRKGRLSRDQFSGLIGRFATPLFLTLLFASAPFLAWGAIGASAQQIPFSAGLQFFFGQLTHLGDLADSQGKFAVISRVGSLLVCLGIAAVIATRVSFGLYFDLLDGSVRMVEGRVNAREDQTMRGNGRDPIEKYFFEVKTDRYPVNLAAYRAIESGSVYLLYILPRSGQLIAVEPKP
jgi:hypothetical protein